MTNRIATPQRTKALLEKYSLSLKKSLGQNFLIDANILRNLVGVFELSGDSGVIEVGPGLGALTEAMAEKAGKVVTVEIDGRLVPVLKGLFAGVENVRIVHADILKLNLHEVVGEELSRYEELVVAANLPYYITTPILLKLLHSGLPFRTIVVMVQKEVAARITASAGHKAYGSLSVAVQYFADAATVMNVPRTAFLPNPNVDSAVLRLSMRDEPAVKVTDEPFFFRVVRAAFGHRRKTIFNNLTNNLFSRDEKEAVRFRLGSAGIDPARRAETVSIEEFARLSEALLPLCRS
ncbi:MAG TPA: 16S rRNA (adenine(1518)-N(6)/adenine(1519)-N(6))-dimethyltransferase RsmA [Bacillales bacterium]|nr:16S rRNA (adenine(1518)-N(6)/adenine(1519)-N(6))-dimethyltransferase RsmA [Bacillales bacterium]